MGATAAKLLIRYRKPIAKAILGFFVFIVVIFLLIFNNDQTAPSGGLATENQNLNESVLRYKRTVEKYARQYDGMEYVPYILALMQIESGGEGGDPMQSSESLGLPPNTIQDPERSIQRGVEFFVENMKSAINRGADIKTALQAYNYGGGFVDFVVKNGGTYSFDLAKQFSINLSGGEKVSYPNPIAIPINGGWRYVYGGASPTTSFDCSGLTQWTYGKAGINLPRTAQQQYDVTQHIPLSEAQAGDLVFFHSTYNAGSYITHVGIYLGNNRMFHAGDPIGYADLTSPYWQQHLVGAGRIKQ